VYGWHGGVAYGSRGGRLGVRARLMAYGCHGGEIPSSFTLLRTCSCKFGVWVLCR
jgi:hypothetical protein